MAADPALASLASTLNSRSIDPKVSWQDIFWQDICWQNISWDDLRAFMALAVHGSLNRAGAALKESQPTIGRRITRLEAVLGLALLKRSVNAVTLTEAGQDLLRATAPMAGAAREIEAVVASHRPRPDAPIRITATTSISVFLSQQILALRGASAPREVLILPSRRIFDLEAGEADIALRMRSMPNTKGMLARKLGTITFAVYGVSSDTRLPMIVPSNQASVSGQAAVAREVIKNRPVGPEIDEMHLRYQAIKSGVGVGCLPCFFGDSDPDLKRIYSGQAFEVREDLYLIRHERTKLDPAIDALATALVTLFRRKRAALSGQ